MPNFIHANTDGPFNPYSKVYDLATVHKDFPAFTLEKSYQDHMHAPPLPVFWLKPFARVLGWHLWVHLIPRKMIEAIVLGASSAIMPNDAKMGNNRLRIMSIVGARPNMMKVAPLLAELRRHEEIEPVLVHTGQHYDYSMSQVFFDQLGVPPPDYNLDVGSGTHYAQTAEIMRKFGELVQQDRPDMVVVAGDVNSTIACALVAAKERIPVAHVEAGLRSFDRAMPEEINRILTDALSDLLFTTEESANRNLANEGVDPGKVFFVGNLMIDSLVRALKIARQSSLRSELGLNGKPYAVLTLHRPSNVDNEDQLKRTLDAIAEVAQRLPVVFPAHPRTARNIEAAGSGGLTAVRIWKGGPLPGLRPMDDASGFLPGFS